MSDYSDKQRREVWEKAKVVIDYDKDKYRQDLAGAWIEWSKYGDKTSSLGWNVDHLKPLSQNGADNISNWVPLQWENNIKKAQKYPEFETAVSSEGNKNILKVQSWKCQ